MPRVVFFDLNATTLDFGPVAAALGSGDDGSTLLAGAVDSAIAIALTAREAGRAIDFPAALRVGLETELERVRGEPPSGDVIDAALAATREVAPFPDASAAVRELRAAGVEPWALTNSGREQAVETLTGSELEDVFEGLVSVEDAGVLKPAAPVYELALERAGVRARDAVLLSAHWWDLWGAAAVGMSVAHVARPAKPLPAGIGLDPVAQGPDLLSVCRALLAERRPDGSP